MITRRAFQLGIACAAAGLGARLRAVNRLNIGVGAFSYHSLSMDDMIAQLKKLRIVEIEMSRGEFMLMNPPGIEMCKIARSKLDLAGIRCASYYAATIKNVQDIEFAIRNAKLFGAGNVSGDATGDVLGAIDRRFTDERLTFGIHNHWFPQKFAYESADDVLRALKGRSNTMGATLDLGQMAACGHDPIDAIVRLRPYLKVVHLKDVEASGAEHNVLLGQGIARIPESIRTLKRIGFQGLVAVEYEKEGDVDSDMEQEIAYARARA